MGYQQVILMQSVEIILNELFNLGVRRVLRIGTAGSLQDHIKAGSLVIATSAVRDEDTTEDYGPKEIPAMASLQMVQSIQASAEKLRLSNIFSGVVHTKSSLFAREFKQGPLRKTHEEYMKIFEENFVIASEM